MAPPSRPTPRRSVRNQKQRQTRLAFSPLPSSSPIKGSYSEAVLERLANVRFSGPSTPKKSRRTPRPEVNSLPTPGPSSQTRSHSTDKLSPSPVRSSRSSPLLLAQKFATAVDSEDEDDNLILPSSKRRRTKQKLQQAVPLSTPARRSGRISNQTIVAFGGKSLPDSSRSHVSTQDSSLLRDCSLSEIGSAETTGDEDDAIVSIAPRRRQVTTTKPQKIYESEDDELAYTSDNFTTTRISPRKRKHRSDGFVVKDDEVEYISSEESGLEGLKPRKTIERTTWNQSPRNSRRMKRREEQELKEDLEDLRDSDPDGAVRTTRTRGGPVTTQRDKAREHLELLRRRRAGEKIPRVHDSDEEYDTGEDGVDLGLIGQPDHPFLDDDSAHSSIETEAEYEDNGEDDVDGFVEIDTAGRRQRPDSEIPLQFTSYASAKPRELFPYIIEWLVKNKIAPAFARDDDLYNLAFARVDDQVKAQAGSRLISSAWNATFKWTILARPEISVSLLPGLDEDNIRTCDACNKTNRPARYDFAFTGRAYSQYTLEPIDNSDDEVESDEEVSHDEAGHVLARSNQHFYLGSHCAANAQMGHKLTHWKHHLNDSVLTYLEEQGALSAESVLARERMNKKQREKQAEAIVDSMEETGMIGELWKDFQNDLDDARLGMEDYTKRGGRSHGRISVIRSSGTDGTLREWRDDKYKETRVVDSDSEVG